MRPPFENRAGRTEGAGDEAPEHDRRIVANHGEYLHADVERSDDHRPGASVICAAQCFAQGLHRGGGLTAPYSQVAGTSQDVSHDA
jgi:hypothetical protein